MTTLHPWEIMKQDHVQQAQYGFIICLKHSRGKPIQDFIAPESVVFVKIDKDTGLLASPYSKETVFQSFKKGTEPTEYATRPEAPKSGNFSEFDMDYPEGKN